MRVVLAHLALASYLLVTLGVVVLSVPPRAAPTAVAAERHPCEGCACGCVSAEQCWLHCCCHSLEERLAWAKRHGVTPPAPFDALLAARHEADSPDGSCCGASSSAGTAATGATPPARADREFQPPAPTPPGPLPVFTPLDCRGLAASLFALAAVPPPLTLTRVTRPVPAAVASLGAIDDHAAAPLWSPRPAVPPPRAR